MSAAAPETLRTAPGSNARLHLTTAFVLNIPFVICHPFWMAVGMPFVKSLAVNAVLFVAPGLALSGLLLGLRWLSRCHLGGVVALSFGVLCSGIVIGYATGLPVSAPIAWNWTWAITNLAVLVNWVIGGPAACGIKLPGKRIWVAGLAFAVTYPLFFWGATRVVPPQGDHDLDLQGTAHALVHRLSPAYQTSRGANYLAHPPLLHVIIAGSFLYFDRLDALAVYDPQSEGAISLDDQWPYYLEHPFLIETRTPNIFLGAMTVALLALWIANATGSGALALLLSLGYATLPEVFVRSSYGGYFAISKFFALQMLLAAAAMSDQREGSDRRLGALVGGLAAWANHKLVLLPIAIATWSFVAVRRQRSLAAARRILFHPVVVGFAAGTVLFWGYGLWVSPSDFWNDHIRVHIVDRVLHSSPHAVVPGKYPTVFGLWREFWRDTGYLLLPIGAISLGLLLKSNVHAPKSGETALSMKEANSAGWATAPGLWAIWVGGAAIAFSLIDWRQTKHLTTVILPLVLAPAFAVALKRIPRHVVAAVFVILLVLNLRAIYLLSTDFAALVKLPEW